MKSTYYLICYCPEGNANEPIGVQEDYVTSVLGLAEILALPRDPCVKEFVKLLYMLLFRQYADESYCGTMLERLVVRSTNATDNGHEK
ncbi:hypothetical protein K1719_044659 [Acacia pycnantha]|nr:hypothetical protein K1719_044659 [Acacia pycnantha]